MTLLGQLVVYFPIVHFLIIAWTFLLFVEHPSALTISWLMFCTYLVPPLLYRLYSFGRPVQAARLVLNRREHCHWWIAHQMQMLYAAVPAFEALLRLVPGLYSAWLRLWGSTVGKRVYWTPCVEIIDRHMLAIGDDVIFGHRVVCSSHAITKRPTGELILLFSPTRIGSGTFLGAKTRIGPGVRIPEKTVVPYNTEYRFAYAE